MTFIRRMTEVLICNRCGKAFLRGRASNGRRKERAAARAQGWTIRWARNRTMQDWCPECSR